MPLGRSGSRSSERGPSSNPASTSISRPSPPRWRQGTKTGIFTEVGPITAGDDNVIDDLAIDSQGNLYGLNRLDDSLYAIDRTTGAGAPVGGLGFDFVAGGMDFDWTTDTLYAVLNTDYAGSSVFASIDVATGLATVLEDTAAFGVLTELAVQEPLPRSIGALDPLCVPVANSTGSAATIDVIGSGAAGDPLRASCLQGPPGQFGYFVSGPNPGLYVVPPSSSGILCIASPQYRYSSVLAGQVFWFDTGGTSQAVAGGGRSLLPTDGSYAPVPAALSGTSRAFQAWYRDVGGQISNFSESRIVLFH
ncbi:MAG: hypothetical protein GY711_31235 [bacterium]|nr:hypothetical protein [bacterium]